MDRFDSELFIDEIEKRPALWDMQCKDYANKTVKKRGWEEVVEVFADADETPEKKAILCNSLQKKWKNLRDAYTKEVKKLKTQPSGSGSQPPSTYIFFVRLSFLQKCLDNKPTTTNIRNEEVEQQSEDTTAENTEQEEIRRPVQKKRKALSAADERFADLIQKSMQSREKIAQENLGAQDEDKLFCLSLYKELTKVPEGRRLSTKIELLNVLQKAQSENTPQQGSVNNPHHLGFACNPQGFASRPQGFWTNQYLQPLRFGGSIPVPTPSPSPSPGTPQSESSVMDLYSDSIK